MIDSESFSYVYMLIKQQDPEYEHDYFTILSKELNNDEWTMLERCSSIHSWVAIGDEVYVNVSKIINGFTVMYCKE